MYTNLYIFNNDTSFDTQCRNFGLLEIYLKYSKVPTLSIDVGKSVSHFSLGTCSHCIKSRKLSSKEFFVSLF